MSALPIDVCSCPDCGSSITYGDWIADTLDEQSKGVAVRVGARRCPVAADQGPPCSCRRQAASGRRLAALQLSLKGAGMTPDKFSPASPNHAGDEGPPKAGRPAFGNGWSESMTAEGPLPVVLPGQLDIFGGEAA